MKKTSKKLSTLLAGAAIAGLLAGTATLTSCSGDKQGTEHNGCKGQNGCKTGAKEQNSCKGHNGCNGANGCASKEGEKKPAAKGS